MDNETFLGYTLSRTNMLETRTRVDNLGSERHCNPVIFLNRVIPFPFFGMKNLHAHLMSRYLLLKFFPIALAYDSKRKLP